MAFEYATKIYLDAANGNDGTGDGSLGNPYQFFDTSPAKSAVETGALYQYNVNFISDTSENIELVFNSSGWGAGTQPAVKFTFLNGSKQNGVGDFIYVINTSGGQYWGVWCVGANISGYSKSIRTNQLFCATVFEKSKITGGVFDPQRASKCVFIDTYLKDIEFSTIQVSSNPQFSSHSLLNCTLDNVTVANLTYPYITLDPRGSEYSTPPDWVGGFEPIIRRNYFKNMDLVIVTNNAVGTYFNLMYNNYENVRGGFYDITNTVPAPLVVDLVPFGSVAAMQAEYLSVFGTPTTLYANETFKTIPIDGFGYPTDRTVNYLNRHQGAYRYAITQTVPVANADYTDVLGVYESNTLTPTPLVYELEVPRAGFARTATLHFTRSGNTEQLGTNGEVEILIETSTDGTNFATLGTFLSGIDSGTLDFDFLNAPAKAIRASIQPTGAAFGEIQIEGSTVDFKTLEDRLSQTDTRTLYTAGNVPANVSELYNRAIHNPIANFTQAVEANQFSLSGGGLTSLDGDQWMELGSLDAMSNQSFTMICTFMLNNLANLQVVAAYKCNYSSDNPAQIFVNNAGVLTINYRSNVGSMQKLTQSGFIIGKIYYVAAVLDADNSKFRMFVDGILVQEADVVVTLPAQSTTYATLGRKSFLSGDLYIISAGSKIYNYKFSRRPYSGYEIQEDYRTDQFNNEHLR